MKENVGIRMPEQAFTREFNSAKEQLPTLCEAMDIIAMTDPDRGGEGVMGRWGEEGLDFGFRISNLALAMPA